MIGQLEDRKHSGREREGGGGGGGGGRLGKGPRVRTRILDAQSATPLYVGVLPTKLLAQTKTFFFKS